MNNSHSENLLSSDTPLSNPDDDELGFAPFAQTLASSIVRMTPPEGLVIAVYAPWGSGKSTLINFVASYLREEPPENQPIIVTFNPWWFSGQENLRTRFFEHLLQTLDKSDQTFQEVKKKINIFADAIAKSQLPHSQWAKLIPFILGTKAKNVQEQKDDVVQVLRKQRNRILVIIDDIDRLMATEIKEIFQLIKAVADFPNVTYLLAMDKRVAIAALGEPPVISGQEYLEKIVQVPFELPVPDKVAIRTMLFRRINEIIRDTPEELIDKNHWSNIYFEGIDFFINTPRDLVRITNTLRITYPTVFREVNPVDFIAIETLRVFRPPIYDIVRRNPDMFAGLISTPVFGAATKEKLVEFHDSWISNIEEKDVEHIKRFLSRLFPKLDSVWGNMGYADSFLSEWTRKLRICSPDKFPIYFRFAVPESKVSNAEILALITLTSNSEAFGNALVSFSKDIRADGMSRVAVILEQLENYTSNEINEESIQPIIDAFFEVGDELLRPQDEGGALLGWGNDVRIGRIIFQLLRRLEEAKRHEILANAIKGGSALSTIVHEVRGLSAETSGERDEISTSSREDMLSVEHGLELQNLALEKVRTSALDGTLMIVPNLVSIFYRWKEWAGNEEPRQWVESISSEDEGLMAIIEAFVQKSHSWGGREVGRRTTLYVSSASMEPFFNLSEIFERVKELVDSGQLTNEQKTALELFLKGYESWERGEDPFL